MLERLLSGYTPLTQKKEERERKEGKKKRERRGKGSKERRKVLYSPIKFYKENGTIP